MDAVLGNHDWWGGGPRLAAALERRGVRVLENTARPIEPEWVLFVIDAAIG